MYPPHRFWRCSKKQKIDLIFPGKVRIGNRILAMSPQILPDPIVKNIVSFHLPDWHMQHIIKSLIEIEPYCIFMQNRITSIHKLLHSVRILYDIQKDPGKTILRPSAGRTLLPAYYMITLFWQDHDPSDLLQHIYQQTEILIQHALRKPVSLEKLSSHQLRAERTIPSM